MIPVPGPTALVPALVVSGLPVDRFAFEGFLPAKSAARRKRLAELRSEQRTMIFYEAPHRLVDFLADLEKELGNRDLAIARELTKVHEEVLRGPANHLAGLFRSREPKGELVVVCEGAKRAGSGNPEIAALADRHLEWLLKEKKVSAREAAREVAYVTRMPRNTLYSRAVALARGGKDRSARS